MLNKKNILNFGILFIILSFSLSAESDYASAKSKYQEKNWKATIEEIAKIHDAGGNSYETHVLCAFAYNNLNDFTSSSAHFFQAMKFKPNEPRMRADHIRLFLNHDKTKGALELATEAIERFSEDPEIQFLYAYTLFRRGKPKTALNRVEKLKSISQNDAELLNLEGKIYYSLGNYDKADVSLKWASAINSDSAAIWNNLALVQEKLFLASRKSGKKKEASQYLTEAKDSIQKAISLNAKEVPISKNAERILSYSI
ncbi:tetratricopeptide repeat protein [Leptospira sp. GIMC2001]|uniref:tetratricopeptide repeat protein n=1 Tax=Leptospira sp. GIMC2001 TaxID=1513297 RepID=UPI00234A2239|nr:tetratricopeptide repeat protein [Leptospira sp. GIMC2001]WCL48699.1 tetratricopeptide repeat protein [Leptospira sp. GIMC2001]